MPLLTVLIIKNSFLLIILTFIWPLVGILNIVFGTKPLVWMVGAAVIMFLIGLQLILIWIGCAAPMFDFISGMSDSIPR